MGTQLQELLNNLIQAGIAIWVASCVLGLIAFVFNVFVLVLWVRFTFWFWDWLSLRETVNWGEWQKLHGKFSEAMLGTVAYDQRRRWRTALGLAYLLFIGGPIGTMLFVIGQPAMGWIVVVVVVLLGGGLAIAAIV